MEQLGNIRTFVLPVIESLGLKLYDLRWRQEGSMRVLEVSIMRQDGTMDIDTCASVSEKISEVLDEKDPIQGEYFLEVCSPGAERELRSDEEIKQAISEYIYIKFRNPKAGKDEIKGTLEQVDEHTLLVSYMDKAVKKKIEIEKDNIALIRLSVKI